MTFKKLYPYVEKKNLKTTAAKLYARLTANGQESHTVLLDSGVNNDQAFGVIRSAVLLRARGQNFSIESLSPLGEKILDHFPETIPFAQSVERTSHKLEGTFLDLPKNLSEEARLRASNPLELLRFFLKQIQWAKKNPFPLITLAGAFSFEFLAALEAVPSFVNFDRLEDDFVFYFPEHFFVLNTQEDFYYRGVYLLSEGNLDEDQKKAQQSLADFKVEAKSEPAQFPEPTSKISLDQPSFVKCVDKVLEHIRKGDAFQVQIARKKSMPLKSDPFALYLQLKKNNPSPFQFFLNFDDHFLLGCSPELALEVTTADGNGEREIRIHPIAGTVPVGREGDDRFTAALQTDEKELAEHMMLVDLARNDVAKISKPGTRKVKSLMELHKYSHVQHMVSQIQGVLIEDLDAFHAVAATGNMGTLTGAPKCRATEILQDIEKSPRGFYGGSVGYFTDEGAMKLAIVIRSIRIQEGLASTQAAAGVVLDSSPEKEFQETENKMAACLKVMKTHDE